MLIVWNVIYYWINVWLFIKYLFLYVKKGSSKKEVLVKW